MSKMAMVLKMRIIRWQFRFTISQFKIVIHDLDSESRNLRFWEKETIILYIVYIKEGRGKYVFELN